LFEFIVFKKGGEMSRMEVQVKFIENLISEYHIITEETTFNNVFNNVDKARQTTINGPTD
jgi:hypothetical protein